MKYKVEIFFNNLVVTLIRHSEKDANATVLEATDRGFWCDSETLFVLPRAITDIKILPYEDTDLH